MKAMSEYGIGNTPMVEIPAENGNKIFIKLEGENFLGSAKARTGYQIVHDLPGEAKGKTLVESTSGNLGFALGYFCAEQKIPFLALVDETITQPKIDKRKAAGIRYKMVAPQQGVDLRTSRIEEAKRLVAGGDYYWVNQYNNPSGVKAHELSTGPEIWQQTGGKVTHCVCAMGSGGTIAGVGRFFKQNAPQVKICGAEPVGSTIYASEKTPYINAGAGMTGKPGNIAGNAGVVDEAYAIPDEEAIRCAQLLYHQYGLSVGITSGIAYGAALKIAQKSHDATIVVLSADGREPYKEYLN